jgi:antitoxin VapB
MSLSIKNKETERLARELAALKGESLTAAVTISLRERWERESSVLSQRSKREGLNDFLERIRPEFDCRPVTKEEWDEASGDTG